MIAVRDIISRLIVTPTVRERASDHATRQFAWRPYGKSSKNEYLEDFTGTSGPVP